MSGSTDASSISDMPAKDARPTAPMRRARVGLLWHSVNSDNLGVGALTVSEMAIVDAAAAAVGVVPEYLVIGAMDRRPAYIQRPDLSMKPVRNKDFLKPFGGLFSALRSCDVVIDIGGGDSFADIYGVRRAIWMLVSKWMTLLAGKPLILAPQTVGPFERGWMRRGAVAAMNRAQLTVTRDALSTAYLDEIGYKGPRLEASDVALKLPYEAPPPRDPDGKVRVGINVSGLLFNGGYSRDNQFGLSADYPTMVRAIVEDLRARPEVELHFVGHVIA
ncbi:MAG: polysaccharide pyruvyl transferase family protein, partial [Alphaproteobacteria bacterium]